MNRISRREFIKKVSGTAAGLSVVGNAQIISSYPITDKIMNNLEVFIPMPVQVVIDDVGWWSGEDGSLNQEPYRTGINRNHVPDDYRAIVELGTALDIKPQAATVLCEWDKENILRDLPTSTWMGKRWDNSKWVGPWMEEAAEIIRSNSNNYELTIHGIGHEYWERGTFTRAEWTDSNGQMRPVDQVEKHLEYFEKLMNQHNLGSFPGSFVPAAFRHSFGPSEGREVSLAELLKKKGITYINSPFESMYNRERIQYRLFGFDAGVMTVDRGSDEFPWDTFPANPSKALKGPTCGIHWPNLLHPDPERNSEIVRKWIEYLKPYNNKPDMMLAPDSNAFRQQLAHQELTKLRQDANIILLDFSETDKLPGRIGKELFTVKIKTGKMSLNFESKGIKIISQTYNKESETYILTMERELAQTNARIEIG